MSITKASTALPRPSSKTRKSYWIQSARTSILGFSPRVLAETQALRVPSLAAPIMVIIPGNSVYPRCFHLGAIFSASGLISVPFPRGSFVKINPSRASFSRMRSYAWYPCYSLRESCDCLDVLKIAVIHRLRQLLLLIKVHAFLHARLW